MVEPATGTKGLAILTNEAQLKPYNCPMCMSVVRTPVRIAVCGHLFCQECIKGYIEAQDTKKPKLL